MFPNLRVIGGQELIMNYALVIYQNTHLVEVGLPKLTTIINGGVRIMDNTQLCYSRYIDWGQILIGPANDILTDQNKGSDSGIISFIYVFTFMQMKTHYKSAISVRQRIFSLCPSTQPATNLEDSFLGLRLGSFSFFPKYFFFAWS